MAADPAAGLRLSTRTITTYLFLHEYLYDNITISKGNRCVLRHGLSRPHQHILNTHSRQDALHTLPLTTILPVCLVVRCGYATTIVLTYWRRFFTIVRIEHIEELLTAREMAPLFGGARESRA